MSKHKSERSTFEAITFEHMDALYGTAVRLTRDPKDAEDLVQDTYLKAFRFFDRFEPGTNIKAWLFKIMTNTFINNYRRKRREREVAQAQGGRLLLDSTVSVQRQEALSNPEASYLEGLLSDEVLSALDRLPVDFRMCVILADIQGLSYKEIAAAIERPIGTVMSRLYRGRRMLEKELQAYAIQEGIVGPQRMSA